MASDAVWASPRTRQLFGFSPGEEISFESLLLKVHADDRDAVGLAFSQAAAGVGDGRYQMQFRVGGAGDNLRWISAQGQFEFERQRAVRSRGVCSDITTSKEAERENLRLRDEIGGAAHSGGLASCARSARGAG